MTATAPRRSAALAFEIATTFLRTYALFWALTLGSAIVLGFSMTEAIAHEWIGDRLLLEPHAIPSARAVAELVVHNAFTAGWPLLFVLLRLHREKWQREFGTALLGAFLFVNGAFVGAASAVAGEALVPFLVHLPVEWAAVAVAATGWLVACRRELSRAALGGLAAAFLVLVCAAAVLETYAVPQL